MRNIRVVFAVLSLSVVLVAGVADELQAQEKRQGWIKRLRYRRELRRELQMNYRHRRKDRDGSYETLPPISQP